MLLSQVAIAEPGQRIVSISANRPKQVKAALHKLKVTQHKIHPVDIRSIYSYLYAQAQLVIRIGGLVRVYSIGIMFRFRQSIYNNTDLRTTSIKNTKPSQDESTKHLQYLRTIDLGRQVT